MSLSLRLTGSTQEDISGIDKKIMGPVQTANPNNYGGEFIELGFGINFLENNNGNRISLEFNIPVYQDLNGLQMERDHSFTIGWQKLF